jgi:hypothetical protein
MEVAFESEAFAAAKAPVLNELLTPPLTKRFGFLEKKDPEQVRRGAQHEAAFEATMEADRQLLEERHLARDAVTKAALMDLLGKPTPRKAKEAEVFTCRLCPREYGGKKNYGFCSSKCRAAKKGKCEHGRRKDVCKDCGTGHCRHGRRRRKDVCKDCGTGYCQHGRPKHTCKDCGTGYCQHGRPKHTCKDCGTGHCEHGRRRGRCKDC